MGVPFFVPFVRESLANKILYGQYSKENLKLLNKRVVPSYQSSFGGQIVRDEYKWALNSVCSGLAYDLV